MQCSEFGASNCAEKTLKVQMVLLTEVIFVITQRPTREKSRNRYIETKTSRRELCSSGRKRMESPISCWLLLRLSKSQFLAIDSFSFPLKLFVNLQRFFKINVMSCRELSPDSRHHANAVFYYLFAFEKWETITWTFKHARCGRSLEPLTMAINKQQS